MALHTPPSWLQNGSHPAENDRLTATGVLFKTGGVADSAAMKVAPLGTPGMAVQISAGHAIVAGTQTANQGFYIAYNDAATQVAIATASTTNPRIDRVCVVVQDAYYGGTANNQVIFQVVTGTPSSSPVPPAAPANSVTLAYVAVAANATSISNGNITDLRAIAQFSESQFSTQTASASTIVANMIAAQTGKAFQVKNSSGVQIFAVNPDGSVTFADGSTQTSAATYNPNLIINAQTGTSYTLVASDAQKLVTLANSGAIALTIASNATQALPVGTQVTIAQYGTGQVTVSGASSPNPVTIVSTGATAATPKTRAQYSTLTLIQTSTDNWLAVGDLV